MKGILFYMENIRGKLFLNVVNLPQKLMCITVTDNPNLGLQKRQFKNIFKCSCLERRKDQISPKEIILSSRGWSRTLVWASVVMPSRESTGNVTMVGAAGQIFQNMGFYTPLSSHLFLNCIESLLKMCCFCYVTLFFAKFH